MYVLGLHLSEAVGVGAFGVAAISVGSVGVGESGSLCVLEL